MFNSKHTSGTNAISPIGYIMLFLLLLGLAWGMSA